MLSMLVDAYRVLDLLAKHPRIDAKRIGILGGSEARSPLSSPPCGVSTGCTDPRTPSSLRTSFSTRTA